MTSDDRMPPESAGAPDPEALHRFWFADAACDDAAAKERVALWFAADERFDALCRAGFATWPDHAARGELDAWRAEPRSALALVLTLDQLPRNLFRGTQRAFAYDARAREVASGAVDAGFDARLAPIEASFLYLPFEHAEDPSTQDRSVALFERLVERASPVLRATCEEFVDYARRHREVIARFGRFPHRNAALGRASTADEVAWLARATPF